MIFDTISVKARWERWYRWNCDLRVINARKKKKEAFSVVPKASPWRPNHVTICLLRHWLWGVAAKWPTRAPKTKLILCPRDTQGYSLSGLSLSGRILKECEIALTEVLATQMGVMRRNKKVSSFELYKLNPLSPHCGSVARELVHCYTWGRLRIVTVRGNTVGRHS